MYKMSNMSVPLCGGHLERVYGVICNKNDINFNNQLDVNTITFNHENIDVGPLIAFMHCIWQDRSF